MDSRQEKDPHETRQCPQCGGLSTFDDIEFCNENMKRTRLIYHCGSCDLYWRKIRGKRKKRAYINCNDDEITDVLDYMEGTIRYGK